MTNRIVEGQPQDDLAIVHFPGALESVPEVEVQWRTFVPLVTVVSDTGDQLLPAGPGSDILGDVARRRTQA